MSALDVVKCICDFCFVKAYGQRSPTISYISQEQIKDIGGIAELHCSVQYAQEYPVLWMKVDHNNIGYSVLISTGSSLILHDSRFSLRYDQVIKATFTQITNPFSSLRDRHSSFSATCRNKNNISTYNLSVVITSFFF